MKTRERIAGMMSQMAENLFDFILLPPMLPSILFAFRLIATVFFGPIVAFVALNWHDGSPPFNYAIMFAPFVWNHS